ncbi:hypothetical protein BO71DRAFT_395496 [Aspergillus ellipticus CBS 707.79]|uniref:Uncharacterized protein n=1 Tax=Aspergillus ellipticus CBS 707.79 TaxID=1448320 RepID=A0A319F103_9EURO|nr:hypothetical protein BO71DRAFT_395496 [Aspergillus ellipticus CBS 707.79]
MISLNLVLCLRLNTVDITCLFALLPWFSASLNAAQSTDDPVRHDLPLNPLIKFVIIERVHGFATTKS